MNMSEHEQQHEHTNTAIRNRLYIFLHRLYILNLELICKMKHYLALDHQQIRL